MNKTSSRIIKKETEGFALINEELKVYAYNFNGEKTRGKNYDIAFIEYPDTKNRYLLVNINNKDFFFYKNIIIEYLEANERDKNNIKAVLRDDVINILDMFAEYLKDEFSDKFKALITKKLKKEIDSEIPAFKEQIDNYLKLIS